MRRRWLLIAMIIIVAGISYTAYLLFSHKEVDSLTVSELKSQAEFLYGQQTRVEGKVAPGTIDWDSGSQTLRFVLADDGESLVVVFQGIVPDNFKPGDDLIVEGRYRTDGVFEALNFGGGNSFCSFCH